MRSAIRTHHEAGDAPFFRIAFVQNRPVREFIDSDYSFVNEGLTAADLMIVGALLNQSAAIDSCLRDLVARISKSELLTTR